MKTKLSGILTLLLAFVVQFTFAQDRTITGQVTDDTGPLPGVSVLIVGTETGTETDFDGNFTINADTGDVLQFSFVGMTTVTRTIGTDAIINVILISDANTLDEVVVTALGIKREEKALGYSIQSISGETMTEARETNISNALSGRIAGVQVTSSSGNPGSSSRIVLRGNSSITGNNEPLYIVDGVPIDNTSYGNAGSGGGVDLPNGAADINPDDIESIVVLKGPNAAALYGLRAGNGVIVITTKKGDGGKFSVTLNTNVTFSNPLILPDYQNSYGQGGDTNFFEYVDGASGGVGDGVDESWGPPLDVGLEFVQWDSQLTNNGLPTPWISHPNNVGDFLDTGVTVANNVSITSGKTRLSFGNTNEKGMIPNTDMNKITISIASSLDIGEKFTASISANYWNTDSDNIPITGYNNENPLQQFIWSARNVNFRDLDDWRNFPLAPSNTAAAGTPLSWNHNFQNNPYWVLDTNINTFAKDRIVGTIDLVYEFNDWITLAGKIGSDFYSQFETSRQAVGSNNAVDGSYFEIQRRFEEINASFLLTFVKNYDNFGWQLNLGGNRMSREYNATSGNLPALELPDLYSLSNLKTGATATTTSTVRDQSINSLYAFGQFSFKSLLFLDLTARNDWASVLPLDNNSFFYPSASLSVILSELFSSNSVSMLKVRGSYAIVGSTGALAPYNITPTFGLFNTGFGNQGFLPNTQFNPNLTAETITGIEFGIDAVFFKNRLRFSGSVYDQKSEDLLVPIQVSSSTGFTNLWDNIADMTNQGIEIVLGGSVVRNDDWLFDIDLNWARNTNEVTSLGGLDAYVLGGQWGITLEARPGNPYGDLVGRDFERTDDGEVIYEGGLPKISSEQVVLGNITPEWTGGANFSLSWKNLSLYVLFDGKYGGDVHSMTYSWGRYAGTLSETLQGRETGIVGDGVMSDGNGGYVANDVVVPAKSFNQASYSNDIESSAIFDATYIKLRQITLGYQIPYNLFSESAIEGIKFSLVGRNLALLYKRAPHIDPETGFSSANGEQGQEFGQYPSARNIGFNINIQF